jgi:hypothetical protein
MQSLEFDTTMNPVKINTAYLHVPILTLSSHFVIGIQDFTVI